MTHTLLFNYVIMNEYTLISAMSAITQSWYLDVKFLLDRVEEHSLELSEIIENVEFNFWKENISNINYLIHETLNQIANNFINSNKELFENESDEFEIYTNYLDSHVWFRSENVQLEFENFY